MAENSMCEKGNKDYDCWKNLMNYIFITKKVKIVEYFTDHYHFIKNKENHHNTLTSPAIAVLFEQQ